MAGVTEPSEKFLKSVLTKWATVSRRKPLHHAVMHEDTFESGNDNVQISVTMFSLKNNDSLLILTRGRYSLLHLMAQSREKLHEVINIHIRRICAWSVAILPLKSVWLFHCQNYGKLSPSVFSRHRKGMHFTAHLMLSTCSELTKSEQAILAAESNLTSVSLKTCIRTHYWVGVALWLVNDKTFRSSRTAQSNDFT